MAYDFLGIVNDINRRSNEVELTTDNFNTVTGYYSAIKDSVNSSINFINQHEYEWPFNHSEEEETLTENIVRYSTPGDAKTIDWDSFRIARSATLGNETVKLKLLSYEEYLDKYVDYEYNSELKGMPRYVFQTPSREYGLVPAPDKAYTIFYEYYRLPVDLVNNTDVPSLPEYFRHVIVDGAMYYLFMFKGDMQAANALQQKFLMGIKHLRSTFINRTNYVRDTRVHY